MRVAFLIHDEFQDDSLRQPLDALLGAGHSVVMVGPQQGRTYVGKHLRERVEAGLGLDLATADEFDALFIPGGYAPEKLRLVRGIEGFVRAFAVAGKPIAATCRAAQLLISADVVRGRRLTCYDSIVVDVTNAGGIYVDAPVVVDHQLVTSRKPADLPAFCQAVLTVFAGGQYEPEQPAESSHPSLKR